MPLSADDTGLPAPHEQVAPELREVLGEAAEVFSRVYPWAEAFADQARRGRAPDLRDAILVVLSGLLELLATFDRRAGEAPDGVRYAANVMVFVPDATLRAHHADLEAGGYLRFWDGPRTDLAGVLDLRRDLATYRTPSEILVPQDDKLAAFALPVPKPYAAQVERGGDHLWRTLPGAPMAWLTGQASHFRDARQLAEWCEDRGAFQPEHVTTPLRDYFADPGEGREIRSFVAYPIARKPLLPGRQSDPIGVLNLHADRPGLLIPSDEISRVGPFFDVAYPLVIVLLQTLTRLRDVGSGEWTLQVEP